MKKTLALGISATLLAVGAWSFGCSSSSTGGTAGDAGGGGPDASTTRDGGGGGGRDGGGGGGEGGAPNPDEACAVGADADSCANCCVDRHKTGQRTFIISVHTCECGTNGPCKGTCANSFCAPDASNPDQQCLTCLTNDLTPDAGTPCYGQVDQACSADPDCVAEQNCFGICP